MRKIVMLALVGLLALPLIAQERTSRFELTQKFVEDWSASPVMNVDVKVLGAATQHPPDQDCEIHVGAEFKDDSFTDFAGVVIEPPNVCKFKAPGGGDWKTVINAAAAKKPCGTSGFMRAWPEHLKNGKPPSNPNHFLEIHPALTLDCGKKTFDFAAQLKAFPDLGYKSPDVVEKMIDMHLWVCRGCGTSEESDMLSFDYCFGDPKCTAGQASNFGRMKATILHATIKQVGGANGTVATAIARITPKGSTSGRTRTLKLYAIKGTAFYDDLVGAMDKSTDSTFEIIGIFTLDPLSIKRTIETIDGKTKLQDETWTPVMHPVSLVVFGTLKPSS